MNSRVNATFIALIACIASFRVSFATNVVPPILPLVMRDLGLSHFEGGTFMAVFGLPMIVTSIPTSILIRRRSIRTWGLITSILTIAGDLLCGSSNQFSMLLGGRLFCGLGAGVMTVLALKLIASSFSSDRSGAPMGAYFTFYALGVSAPLLFSAQITAFGWRTYFHVSALIGIVGLFCFLSLSEGEEKESAVSVPDVAKSFFARSILSIAGFWFLFNLVGSAFVTWAPDFLTETKGFNLAEASSLTGLMLMANVPVAPLAGFISDRARMRRPFMMLPSVALAMCFLILPLIEKANVLLIMIFMGVAAPMVGGPTFALLSEVDPFGVTGVGLGAMYTSLGLATLMGPPMMGLFRDLTHNYWSAFISLSIISIICPALVLLSARLCTTAYGKTVAQER